MQLNHILNELDRQITTAKTELVFLEERKQAFVKLATEFPDAHYERNYVCVDNLWEKMTCMRTAWGYGNSPQGYYSTVNVRFSVGKKDMVDNIRLHSYPYNNVVANIMMLPNQNRIHQRTRELTVLDYSNIIPMNCPKRKDFMKRIRNYLLRLITEKNMKLNDNSYNVDEFNKLISLR